VALVRTDVLEELSASFIKVTRIGELGTMLAVTSSPILVTVFLRDPTEQVFSSLQLKTIRSSFLNAVFSGYLEFRAMFEVHKP
jgi:hypothetical protein